MENKFKNLFSKRFYWTFYIYRHRNIDGLKALFIGNCARQSICLNWLYNINDLPILKSINRKLMKIEKYNNAFYQFKIRN